MYPPERSIRPAQFDERAQAPPAVPTMKIPSRREQLFPALVGEASLCLWLLVKGVNHERWREKASVWHASAG